MCTRVYILTCKSWSAAHWRWNRQGSGGQTHPFLYYGHHQAPYSLRQTTVTSIHSVRLPRSKARWGNRTLECRFPELRKFHGRIIARMTLRAATIHLFRVAGFADDEL